MRATAIVLGLACLLGVGVACAADGALLIRNVTLIDGTGVEPLPHASVLAIGERIALVSPGDIKPPRGATVIDGKGKYLMPGLINSHIHLPGGREGSGANRKLSMDVELGTAVLQAMLYSGVTAGYDSGNHDEFIFRMREDEHAGRIVGARLYTTGRMLTPAKGYQCCSGALQVTDYDSTLPALDAMLARQPDMIKITREGRGMSVRSEDLALIPLDVMTRLVEHVHEAGLRVSVHISDEKSARESIAAGVDALAHPVYLEEASPAFAKLVAAKGLPVSTTLGRLDTDLSVFDRPIFVATLNDEDRAENKANPMYRSDSARGGFRASLKDFATKNLRALHDAGAVLAMGTDRSMGAYVHREMELLSEAGIPNLAITRIATLNSAIYMGRARDLGSIERGKLADMLLLSADPVADIRNTARIEAVFLGGRMIDRSTLKVPANEKR